MAATPRSAERSITVQALDRAGATVTIIGKTPLLVNKMSAKARNMLLLGGRKKSAAETAGDQAPPVRRVPGIDVCR